MLTIAICDDESHFTKKIREILTDYLNSRGLLYKIDEFESGKDFVKLGIEMARYNIVFLDINMDEMDGIETAGKIREISNEMFIVFITAFINYAINGYEVGAIRYILKNNVNLAELIYECMDAIRMKMNYIIKRKTFCFIEGKRDVSLERLFYIESRLHKAEFYIMEDKLRKYSLYGKLDDIEKELSDDTFLRLHQSFLVNMKYIDKINRYEALLSNGVTLKIPKNRYKYVEERYVAYEGEM